MISHVTLNLDADDEEAFALVKAVIDEDQPLRVRIADRSESKVGLDYVLRCGTSVRELAVEMVKPETRLAAVEIPIRKVGVI